MKKCSDVVGYVFFHRHGHRAPAKNIFSSAAESKIWESWLPDETALQNLSSKYPVMLHESITSQPDCKSKPFGYITKPGMEHLRMKGRTTRDSFSCLNDIASIDVYSTNYRRTQVSRIRSLLFVKS